MSNHDPFRPVDPSVSPRADGYGDRDPPHPPLTASDSTDALPRAEGESAQKRPFLTADSEPRSTVASSDVDTGRPVSLETVCSLLADSRRRRLLSRLRSVDGAVSLRALTADLADTEPEPVGEGARRAIELSLVHNHLPRLSSIGLIDYDRDRRRVRPTDAFRSIEGHIATMADVDDERTDG